MKNLNPNLVILIVIGVALFAMFKDIDSSPKTKSASVTISTDNANKNLKVEKVCIENYQYILATDEHKNIALSPDLYQTMDGLRIRHCR